MRKLALLLILVQLVSAACHHNFNHGVTGSGKRAMQKRDVASFTSISTQGAFDIQVVCQKPVSLEIEGDDNILPLITTEVNNSVLYIKGIQNYSVREPINVRISVPNLDGITMSGAGKTDISGIKNDKFEIDTSGAAKIDTSRLQASRAVVDSKGVSKVDLSAADQLDVTISGPSRVTYKGDPVVTKTVHGPGSVEKKTATEGT